MIKPLMFLPHQPMDDETGKIFFQCMMMESRNEGPTLEEVLETPQAKIIRGRVPDEIELSVPLILFFACTLTKPGCVVQWAHTFYVIGKLRNSPVTLSILAEYFPFGFPSDEDMGVVWRAQKFEKGNQIDHFEFWEESVVLAKAGAFTK